MFVAGLNPLSKEYVALSNWLLRERENGRSYSWLASNCGIPLEPHQANTIIRRTREAKAYISDGSLSERISNRSVRVLKNSYGSVGLTVGQLRAVPDEVLLRMPGCGVVVLREIRDMSFGMNDNASVLGVAIAS